MVIEFRATVEQTLAPKVGGGQLKLSQVTCAVSARAIQSDAAGTLKMFEAVNRIWVQEGTGAPKSLVNIAQKLPMILRGPVLSAVYQCRLGRHIDYREWVFAG